MGNIFQTLNGQHLSEGEILPKKRKEEKKRNIKRDHPELPVSLLFDPLRLFSAIYLHLLHSHLLLFYGNTLQYPTAVCTSVF